MKDIHEMTTDERKEEIERLRKENHVALSMPTPFDGNISPYQLGRMSKRQSAQYDKLLLTKIRITQRIKDLSKTDKELEEIHRREMLEKARSRVLQMTSYISFLKSVGTGKKGKVKPSYQKIITSHEAELALIYEEWPELNKNGKE